ncbi:GDP-mannose 4,6-dehydratase [Ramlibacter sp. AN1015]|uniref:GDP-mannose 4,6-dehydratase n=1 Tax=Ramlibacter sp. AN1015 TaxID=3133428 RepID=UPI004040A514
MTTHQSTDSKVALVTGITGQDGSCLAESLLDKSNIINGTSFDTQRVDCSCEGPNIQHRSFILKNGDLTETPASTGALRRAISRPAASGASSGPSPTALRWRLPARVNGRRRWSAAPYRCCRHEIVAAWDLRTLP